MRQKILHIDKIGHACWSRNTIKKKNEGKFQSLYTINLFCDKQSFFIYRQRSSGIVYIIQEGTFSI